MKSHDNHGEASVMADRQRWMSILARSDYNELNQHWDALNVSSMYDVLRPAEVGMMMVKGRMNGSGTPFNVGEVTVTRCAIKLASGRMGTAYVLGRNKQHAELAAIIDGQLQNDGLHDTIQQQVIEPLAKQQQHSTQLKQTATESTQVDFFTLVRGED
ncbi:MAG: phosphonate C-P lyase system protein PhnG [Arenicella sp.]